jgi:hypothetical protein
MKPVWVSYVVLSVNGSLLFASDVSSGKKQLVPLTMETFCVKPTKHSLHLLHGARRAFRLPRAMRIACCLRARFFVAWDATDTCLRVRSGGPDIRYSDTKSVPAHRLSSPLRLSAHASRSRRTCFHQNTTEPDHLPFKTPRVLCMVCIKWTVCPHDSTREPLGGFG